MTMTTTALDLHRAYGAAHQATRDLLAIGDELPPRARDIVETLALILGVDDPHEDGARTAEQVSA